MLQSKAKGEINWLNALSLSLSVVGQFQNERHNGQDQSTKDDETKVFITS